LRPNRVNLHELMDVAKRQERPRDLWGLLESRTGDIEYDIIRRYTYGSGANVRSSLLTVNVFICLDSVLAISEYVTVINIVVDVSGDCFLELALFELVLHVRLNGDSFILICGVLVCWFPSKPILSREQSRHIVSMEVVPYLAKFRPRGLVLPRKAGIRGRLGIRCDDVLLHLRSRVLPLNPCRLPQIVLVGNHRRQILWDYQILFDV